MGEVIDFQKYVEPRTLPNPNWMKFIEMMRKHGLDEDDIEEVIDCVADIRAYEDADQDIRRIADVWINHGG
jgi:hypothetical protein